MRGSARRTVVAGVMIAVGLVPPLTPSPARAAAPGAAGPAGDGPGRYVVVLHPGGPAGALRAASGEPRTPPARRVRQDGWRVQRQFPAVGAFSASLTPAQLQRLRQDPDVALVEPDRVVRATAVQEGAPWGLDRLDQRAGLDGRYSAAGTGAGVTAYVLDTGIRATHAEFGGRVRAGFTAVDDGNGTADCNGHGTHVAGTIGGATYGVAKGIALVPVRVLGCDGTGTTSSVIAGVDWVTEHAAGAAVANLSLGGGASAALDAAVNRSIGAGVTYVVAAGNDGQDACSSSPARVPAALTVGATDPTDARAAFSNTGPCLDLFAPGVAIPSSVEDSDTAVQSYSGTSMAAPHVAGAVALRLQAGPPSPSSVTASVVAGATGGTLSGIGDGSPNRLVYADPAAGTSVPAPTTPRVACTGTVRTYTGSLTRSGAKASHPKASSYRGPAGGRHVGCLSGPAGADFNLYLERFNASTWTRVASARTRTSSERISYSGPAGTYRWLVTDRSGHGRYTLRTVLLSG